MVCARQHSSTCSVRRPQLRRWAKLKGICQCGLRRALSKDATPTTPYVAVVSPMPTLSTRATHC
jgi:hypothetical protein